MHVGFLGPFGSYSEQALHCLFDTLSLFEHVPQALFTPVGSLRQLIQAVSSDTVFCAVLPVENALEGSVLEVLEALSRPETELDILLDWSIPIQHVLAVLPQTPPGTIQLKEIQLEDIQTILSHPQALGQCRETLYERFGEGLTCIPTASTSDAIQSLQALSDPKQGRTTAIIASAQAAQTAGLTVLMDNVADAPHNTTRFVLVCSKQHGAACRQLFSTLIENSAQGLPRLKTSVCFQTLDEPGALVRVLQAVYQAGFNLSKIESRPSRTRMGEYRFFMDAMGDCTPESVPGLWEKIRPLMTSVSVLPAYWSLGEHLPAS
jgi:prephenate dehydratase